MAEETTKLPPSLAEIKAKVTNIIDEREKALEARITRQVENLQKQLDELKPAKPATAAAGDDEEEDW